MATDLFAPRKALTAHLEQLIDGVMIRGVGQAQDLSDVLDGREPAQHGFVYVTFDKSKNISTQGKNSIKSVETYTLTLAWRNSRADRSGHGHGMDDAGIAKDLIEFHVHGWMIDGDYASPTTGKPFTLAPNPPEAFYRPGGWAYYPMSFDIPVTRTRPKN